MKNYDKHLILSILIFLTLSSIPSVINCSHHHLGLGRQIELIEEWGCYNTEIRLTCKDLDSTIGILEATFIPNSASKLMSLHSNRLKETETGRKFLEALRSSEEIDVEITNSYIPVDLPSSSSSSSSSLGSGHQSSSIDKLTTISTLIDLNNADADDDYLKNNQNNQNELHPRTDSLIEQRHKRTSLKANLEYLLVKYLRKLENDDNLLRKRLRRFTAGTTTTTTTTTTTAEGELHDENSIIKNIEEDYDADADDDDDDGDNSNNVEEDDDDDDRQTIADTLLLNEKINRIELGSRNIIVNNTIKRDDDDDDGEKLPIDPSELYRRQRYEKVKSERSICNIRNITQRNMERSDLDKSLQNESDYEHNIRNLINYRCSGKNHCTFIFSVDHPFATLWTNVTVRIKYICIEAFRLNKYCGEKFSIGPEYHQRIHHRSIHNSNKGMKQKRYFDDIASDNEEPDNIADRYLLRQQLKKGEPIAEPRIQYSDKTHHVTILNGTHADIKDGKKNPHHHHRRKGKMRQSYDFQLVRILESDKIEDNLPSSSSSSSSSSLSDSSAVAAAATKNKQTQRKTTTTTFPILINEINDDMDDIIDDDDVDDGQFNTIDHHHHHHHHSSYLDVNQKMNQNHHNIKKITTTTTNINDDDDDDDDDAIESTIKGPTFTPYNDGDDEADIENNNNVRIVRSTENYDILIREGEEIITPYGGSLTTTPISIKISHGDSIAPPTTQTSNTNRYADDIINNKNISITDNEIIIDGDNENNNNNNKNNNQRSNNEMEMEQIIKINSSQFMVQHNEHNETLKKFLDKLVLDNNYNYSYNNDNLQNINNRYEDDDDDDEYPMKIQSTSSTSEPTVIYKNVNNNSVIKYYNRNNNNNNNGGDLDDETDYDYSYEDYAISYNGLTVSRKNKIRIHTSHQKQMIRHQLWQGFLATPGYPEFYIGETKCVWTIIAPTHLKIQLILLDINLKYDPKCEDFIEIIDLNTGHILFHSCRDFIKPLEIISKSNHLQVIVNTTSILAYAKRGVLLHYAALGCPLPRTPINAEIIHQTENSVRYLCYPAFVFPDTITNNRELFCTSKYTWNHTLPDCIPIEHIPVLVAGAGIVSRLNHNKEIGSGNNNNNNNSTMTDNQTDTVYDIVIPSLVIAGLFAVNAVVFLVIMKYRNKRKQHPEIEELTQL